MVDCRGRELGTLRADVSTWGRCGAFRCQRKDKQPQHLNDLHKICYWWCSQLSWSSSFCCLALDLEVVSLIARGSALFWVCQTCDDSSLKCQNCWSVAIGVQCCKLAEGFSNGLVQHMIINVWMINCYIAAFVDFYVLKCAHIEKYSPAKLITQVPFRGYMRHVVLKHVCGRSPLSKAAECWTDSPL